MTLSKQTNLPLSRRQASILHWVSLGKDNGDIALIEGLSESTIKNHMGAIFRKLNTSSRAHAVRVAIERGILVI